MAAFTQIASRLNRYPDSAASALRTAIGAKYEIDPDSVVCGAGSETLLDLITRCFAGPGDEVLFPQYSFAMYPIYARAAGALPVEARAVQLAASVDELLGAVTERTRIVLLANPNNPTGTWLDRAAIRRLRASLPPHVLLVLDAAYAEYVIDADYEPGHELLRESPGNVVVTRTFSKAYGLGALRVGWAQAGPSIASILDRVRPVFAVSAASSAAAIAALGDDEHLQRVVAHNAHWQQWLRERLASLRFTPPSEGRGNFVLGIAPAEYGGSRGVAEALRRRGVLVRAVGVPEGLRISIGSRTEMEQLGEALAASVAT